MGQKVEAEGRGLCLVESGGQGGAGLGHLGSCGLSSGFPIVGGESNAKRERVSSSLPLGENVERVRSGQRRHLYPKTVLLKIGNALEPPLKM